MHMTQVPCPGTFPLDKDSWIYTLDPSYMPWDLPTLNRTHDIYIQLQIYVLNPSNLIYDPG